MLIVELRLLDSRRRAGAMETLGHLETFFFPSSILGSGDVIPVAKLYIRGGASCQNLLAS